MAAMPAEQITFDLAGTRTRQCEEVLYPIVCPGCGQHIAAAVPGDQGRGGASACRLRVRTPNAGNHVEKSR